MQETRYFRDLFSLALVLLINSWFVTNINTYPMQFINPRPPPMSRNLMKTTKSTSETSIGYRLDSWSQYDNPEEGREREGDIHMSGSSRKTITTDKTLLWPNGIVHYYVHSSIANDPLKILMLQNALYTIMSKTCIKFVRIQEYSKLPANNWVNMTGHQKGCFSDLGRNAHKPTTLNLDVDACFFTIGHAMHETLHTLGVYHEHMRPDRDEYITIVWANIKKENVFNFHILSSNAVTDYGLPYDYDSIMHYSMTAFSVNRSLPTIIPTAPYVEIGQRDHLSHYDIQKLLIAYNCNVVDTNKSEKNKEFNEKKKLFSRRTLTQPQSLTKVIETDNMKSQIPTNLHKSSLNKLDDKITNLEKSMDRFNQVTLLRSMYPIQPNYYPVPLSPIHLYINFYLHKK